MIARGSSLRGLSEVSTTKSLPRPAASPISGRLARSRSPPQPNTVMTLRGSSAARDELARQRRQIAQRIVGVGIVDDHGEGLAAIDALKSSRHMRERLDAAGNRLRLAAARVAGGRRGQNVVHIHAPDERREDGESSPAAWPYRSACRAG